jgi:hypothetical protein
MSYKNNLESRIRDIYSFIREHRKIIDVSNRPEEKYKSEKKIQQHWAQIRRYLQEYLTICNHQQADIPKDLNEIITAKFPGLPASVGDNIPSSPGYSKVSTMPSVDAISFCSAKKFRLYHQVLQEWKEVHNILQEVITSLTPLIGALELAFDDQRIWDTSLGLRLWRQTRIQLRRLKSFSREVEYIDEPFDDTGGELRGGDWMIEILPLQYELDDSLRKNAPLVSYNLAVELSDTCFTHLYKADKHLREIVGEVCRLSDILLRSVGNAE